MNEIKQTVAENMTLLRKKNKMTQLDLAEKLNYSDKAVSKWERGEAMPDIEVLCNIADLYGVSLDYLVKEHAPNESPATTQAKKEKSNKLTITLLAVILVWFVATFVFVYGQLLAEQNYWLAFIWAIPISAIVLIVFNGIWGKRKFTFILVSVLLWSLLAAIHLHFWKLGYNLWLLYLVGAPAQIAVILWSNLKRKRNN